MLNTEVAQLYWSDIPIKEIRDAYGIAGHITNVTRQAGPAILCGMMCRVCKEDLKVFSRSDAEDRLRDSEKPLYRSRTWFDVCRECREGELADMHRGFDAERERRAARVRDLRSMPYRDYLNTPEWQDRRKRALRSAGFKCQTCSGGGQLHVHHRTYARRGDEWNKDLIVLCAACHQLFHDNGRLAENGRAA
ncbi:MAG: hypothetical protein ABJE71_07505 [Nitratireductor sp.]